uniref:ETS domain-containing protein n=1 Tax=Syphacia muris TaxID=451379 RepID=A0A158R683_9BILA
MASAIINAIGQTPWGPLVLRRVQNYIHTNNNPCQPKPIPFSESSDLERFRSTSPEFWASDDVTAWLCAVVKAKGIRIEETNAYKLGRCNGKILLNMDEQQFKEMDPNYGHILFAEFRQLIQTQRPVVSAPFTVQNLTTLSQLQPLPNSISQCTPTAATESPLAFDPKPSTSRLSNGDSACNKLPHSSIQLVTSNFFSKIDYSLSLQVENCSEEADEMQGTSTSRRKRSTHTKGNKLWEFIRDALKDPETCPSIVRWEDPKEGVFRIVESEKLARLWGKKKNNAKMTYEKLSRAMRTYYDKQILVPVPKTGLYPKKLVYKFGPGAEEWEKATKVNGLDRNESGISKQEKVQLLHIIK